ncbi:glycosyltransferase [Vicingus serpentipes]|uniref:glycosyltransferase n=1 Tax=Vicingus serpentipes TaxID=1926625 RepID=UPI001476BE33|nr:glycosyltransferase [Vicingus serpentipes]
MKNKFDIIILLDKVGVNYSSDSRVFRIAYFLKDNGFKVAILGFHSSQHKKIVIDKNLSIYNIISPDIITPRSLISLRKNEAKKILDMFLFKNIIANDHYMLNLAKLIKQKKENMNLIYDSHEFFQDYQLEFFEEEKLSIRLKSKIWRWIEKKMEINDVKHANEIIAPSVSIASMFEYIFKPKNRVMVIRNVPNFSPLKDEKNLTDYDRNIYKILEKNKHYNIIIYFGFYMEKLNGLEFVLEGLKDLDDNAKLILLGRDVSNGHFDNLIAKYNIQNKIIQINAVPHHLMPLIGKYAKLSIVPTLYNNYLQCLFSLPNKFLESIKMNLPIICINLPEQRQIISTFNNGILLNESDENLKNDLKTAYFKILGNYNYYKENAETCSKHIDYSTDLKELLTKIKREK